MNLKSKLGKRIQELRIKRNLKQSELAEVVGIATKTQSCIETGKNFPSANLIEKYAKAFNVDVSIVLQVEHMVSSETMINEIIDMLKNANDYEIKLIYKLVNNIIN